MQSVINAQSLPAAAEPVSEPSSHDGQDQPGLIHVTVVTVVAVQTGSAVNWYLTAGRGGREGQPDLGSGARGNWGKGLASIPFEIGLHMQMVETLHAPDLAKKCWELWEWFSLHDWYKNREKMEEAVFQIAHNATPQTLHQPIEQLPYLEQLTVLPGW